VHPPIGKDANDGNEARPVLTVHTLQGDTLCRRSVLPNPVVDEKPEGQIRTANLNPGSLRVVRGFVEPSLVWAEPGARYQFERLGYFCVDTESAPGALVFNRTVTLRDTWAKIAKGGRVGTPVGVGAPCVIQSDESIGGVEMPYRVFGRYVVSDPEICHGNPTFRGTRIMVDQVLNQVASGMAWEAIATEWRGAVSMEAISEAVQLARTAFSEHADEYAARVAAA
jgi:uncharacterized protein (DUF433 family)